MIRKPGPAAGRRDTLFHSVREALGAEGCPICALRHQAVHRYLDALLYEQVNDPGLRRTLRRSRGFCREHAALLLAAGDSLGTAILYHDQVAAVLADVRAAVRQAARSRSHPVRWLPGRARRAAPEADLRRRRDPEEPCPACRVAHEAEARHLAVLLHHLDDPQIREAIALSPFLCVPHLVRALELATGRREAEAVLAIAEGKLSSLQDELAELIRTRDYRFLNEPKGEEQTAWFRAVWQLVGWPRDPRRGRPPK